VNTFIPHIQAYHNELYQNNSYSLIFFFIVLFLIFYFIIIRPQQVKTKKHIDFINSISTGDEIITTSGLVGKIITIRKDGYVFLALNNDTKVLIKLNYIVALVPKGTINFM